MYPLSPTGIRLSILHMYGFFWWDDLQTELLPSETLLSSKISCQCRFYVVFFNVKMPSTADKTATIVASTLISLAAAIFYGFYGF